MMNNKWLVMWTLLILPLVLGQESFDFTNPNIYDPSNEVYNPAIYGDEASYDNPDFYANANFNDPRFDWTKVDWTKVPLSRISNVPATRLMLTELDTQQLQRISFEQRQQITSEQLTGCFDQPGCSDDLGNIAEFAQVIPALEQTFGVTVLSLGDAATLQSDVLQANFGEKESLDLSGKKGYWFEVDENGQIIVIEPSQVREDHLTEDDSFTILYQDGFITKDRRWLSVGWLRIREGKAYVKEGEEAFVGGYKISGYQSEVNIYFDNSEVPERNYVVITGNGLDISSEPNGKVIVQPQPGNKLFNMVKHEYLKENDKPVPFTGQEGYEEGPLGLAVRKILDERDTLTITVEGGDRLKTTSRVQQGLTPFIEHEGDGNTLIETGRMSVRVKQGMFWVKPPVPDAGDGGPIDTRNSAPFELVSGENPTQIFRTSSSNRYALYDQIGKEERLLDFQNNLITGSDLGLEVSNELDVNLIKSIEDLRIRFPALQFKLAPLDVLKEEQFRAEGRESLPEDYKDITPNLAQIVNSWLKDKPDIERYVGTFEFNVFFNAVGTVGTIGLGERAFDGAKFLENQLRDLHSPIETIDHEFVHVLDKKISTEIPQQLRKEEFESRQQLLSEYVQRLLARGIDPADKDKIVPLEIEQWYAEAQELNERRFQQYKSLDSHYVDLGIELARPVLKDPKFCCDKKSIVYRVDSLREGLGQPKPGRRFNPNADVPEGDEFLQTVGIKEVADALRRTYTESSYNGEVRREAQALEAELNKLVKERTRLYPYSFTARENPFSGKMIEAFPELSSTYGELHGPEAGAGPVHRKLAQLEYDKVLNTNPPTWMRELVEERYYEAMGGRKGLYCSTIPSPCGSCKIYDVACKAE